MDLHQDDLNADVCELQRHHCNDGLSKSLASEDVGTVYVLQNANHLEAAHQVLRVDEKVRQICGGLFPVCFSEVMVEL